MAVPARRTSKSKKKMRNSHSALTPATLTVCSNCSRHVKIHCVCECGYYRGKKIIKEK